MSGEDRDVALERPEQQGAHPSPEEEGNAAAEALIGALFAGGTVLAEQALQVPIGPVGAIATSLAGNTAAFLFSRQHGRLSMLFADISKRLRALPPGEGESVRSRFANEGPQALLEETINTALRTSRSDRIKHFAHVFANGISAEDELDDQHRRFLNLIDSISDRELLSLKLFFLIDSTGGLEATYPFKEKHSEIVAAGRYSSVEDRATQDENLRARRSLVRHGLLIEHSEISTVDPYIAKNFRISEFGAEFILAIGETDGFEYRNPFAR